MSYTKGWALYRGRATHYFEPGQWVALCGAPIRIDWWFGSKRMRALTICDHCSDARRRINRKAVHSC